MNMSLIQPWSSITTLETSFTLVFTSCQFHPRQPKTCSRGNSPDGNDTNIDFAVFATPPITECADFIFKADRAWQASHPQRRYCPNLVTSWRVARIPWLTPRNSTFVSNCRDDWHCRGDCRYNLYSSFHYWFRLPKNAKKTYCNHSLDDSSRFRPGQLLTTIVN